MSRGRTQSPKAKLCDTRHKQGSTTVSKLSDEGPQNPVIDGKAQAHGWEHSLRAALAVLREIDARYARDRARLEASVGAAPIKRQWLAQLEAKCRKEREPLVLRLADLHQRIRPRPFWRPCTDPAGLLSTRV
jgi:hypothetical protein